MSAKIGMISNKGSASGGTIHERMAQEALEQDYTVMPIILPTRKWCPGFLPNAFLNRRSIPCDLDAVVLIVNAALFLDWERYRGMKKILIWHHYDPWTTCSGKAVTAFVYEKLLQQILRHADEIDCLMVLGEYWRSFFAKYDFRRIEIVYTAYDMEEIDSAVASFDPEKTRQAVGVPAGQRMVYVGQMQRMKGGDRIYEALKDRKDLFLIGSGARDKDMPMTYFKGSYQEYLHMLAACDVALSMSKMYEGWNRTAHEALLMGTPVIGNAIGNSGEWLVGAGQLICHAYRDLPQAIDQVIARREHYSQIAQPYVHAPKFSKAFYAARWRELMADILG